MRLSTACIILSLATAATAQGFFGGFFNRFNPLNMFRPQQPARPARPSRPSRPVPVRPAPSFTSSSGSGLSEVPAPALAQQQQGGGRGNHQWQGRDYILSWREGRNGLSWEAARRYCSGRGMAIVSLDSPAKRDHFMQQVLFSKLGRAVRNTLPYKAV